MNGKQAKRLRAATRQIYHDKIMVPIAEAAKDGRRLKPEEFAKLPTPKDIYKSAKRALKRGRNG